MEKILRAAFAARKPFYNERESGAEASRHEQGSPRD
jgi:hypothetical protein